jgi:hypothetical protein
VLLVHRSVVRKEISLGKEEPGDSLTGDINEALYAESNGGLEYVEGRHEVGLEYDVGRMTSGFRDRSNVHDGIHSADDGLGFSCVGEVGHHVLRGAFRLALKAGTGEVGGENFVTGVDHCLGRGPADLSMGTGDTDLHDVS